MRFLFAKYKEAQHHKILRLEILKLNHFIQIFKLTRVLKKIQIGQII